MNFSIVETRKCPSTSTYLQSMTFGEALSGVRSEMVDFGPRQGRTPPQAERRRRSKATSRTEARGERRIGPKYAIYGWTLERNI